MSQALEIADFIRLTRGLSEETLAKAIRLRWPEASEGEVRQALAAVAARSAEPPDALTASSK